MKRGIPDCGRAGRVLVLWQYVVTLEMSMFWAPSMEEDRVGVESVRQRQKRYWADNRKGGALRNPGWLN